MCTGYVARRTVVDQVLKSARQSADTVSEQLRRKGVLWTPTMTASFATTSIRGAPPTVSHTACGSVAAASATGRRPATASVHPA